MIEYLILYLVSLSTNAHNIMAKEKARCKCINKSRSDVKNILRDLKNTEKIQERNLLKYQQYIWVVELLIIFYFLIYTLFNFPYFL